MAKGGVGRKIIASAATAAAMSAIVYGVKKMREKGYDKEARKMLRGFARKVQTQAARAERAAAKRMEQMGGTSKAPKRATRSSRRTSRRAGAGNKRKK